MFIEIGRCFVNTDHVASLSIEQDANPNEGQRQIVCAIMADGSTIRGHCYEAVEEISGNIVPAVPGLVRLSLYNDDGELIVDRDPIIAWRITGTGWPSPVCPETCNGSEAQAILYPDGQVIEQANTRFVSEAEWLDDHRKRIERKKAA